MKINIGHCSWCAPTFHWFSGMIVPAGPRRPCEVLFPNSGPKEITMGLLDNLSDLAKQFAAGNAPAADVHAAYDHVSQAVPQSSLAEGLTHAFNSDQTPPFGQMLSNLFNQSSPDQKASLLNQIVAKLGPGGVSQILAGAGGMGGLAGVLSGGSVTPAQAQQISPDQVQVLAQNAEKKD